MPPFRFSLLTLLGVTAYVAIGIAAWMYATDLWASTLCGAVVLCLLYGSLKAIYCCGEGRSFWVGFLVFGVTYFGLTEFDIPGLRVPLPTTTAIDYAAVQSGAIAEIPTSTEADPFGIWLPVDMGRIKRHRQIGHALFTLPFAALGGIISRVMEARSRHPRDCS